MSGRVWVRLAACSVVAVVLLPAGASADSELLGLQIRNKVQVGGDSPALILQPQIAVKSLSITLAPTAGGRKVTLRSGKLKRGQRKILSFKQAEGTTEWKADFAVKWGSGEKDSFALTFKTTVYPRIAFRRQDAQLDFANNSMTVRLNQPAAKVDVIVWGTSGEVVHQESTEFDGPEAGTPLEVSWELPGDEGVLKMQVKLWSTFGFWAGAEITAPIEIPHEEIEFDFGKWDVRASEEQKMLDALEEVNKNLRRYKGLANFQLYIAGFTDTVGSRPSNQQLSEKRARSIGTWFRRKGVKVDVYFRGFGEDVLAVKTPDETKEAKNRRAEYVLSDGPPPIKGRISGGWRKL